MKTDLCNNCYSSYFFVHYFNISPYQSCSITVKHKTECKRTTNEKPNYPKLLREKLNRENKINYLKLSHAFPRGGPLCTKPEFPNSQEKEF